MPAIKAIIGILPFSFHGDLESDQRGHDIDQGEYREHDPWKFSQNGIFQHASADRPLVLSVDVVGVGRVDG